MLPRQVYACDQLVQQGLSLAAIKNSFAALKLFPTPFKGIYYSPSEEERKGRFIEKPLLVLTKAIAAYLKSNEFYYTCSTAEEQLGLSWHPSDSVHLANTKRSGVINLAARCQRNAAKKTYRAKTLARILAYYGGAIVFHKACSLAAARFTQTPYGRFATKSQLKKDKKKFKCG